MKRHLIYILVIALVPLGCGEKTDTGGNAGVTQAERPAAAEAPQKSQRGGSITIGDRTWLIIPSIQCSVYPGDVVAIAGHAESDPDLEIVIDNDPNGRSGVSIGGKGQAVTWHSVKESLQMTIDGKQVQGSATFSADFGGGGETEQGTFKVDC